MGACRTSANIETLALESPNAQQKKKTICIWMEYGQQTHASMLQSYSANSEDFMTSFRMSSLSWKNGRRTIKMALAVARSATCPGGWYCENYARGNTLAVARSATCPRLWYCESYARGNTPDKGRVKTLCQAARWFVVQYY